jgi:hypothetical protein
LKAGLLKYGVMKRLLIKTLLLAAFAVNAGAQKVVKTINGYIAIKSTLFQGNENDILTIQRIVDGRITDIGTVKILKTQDDKIAAKILQEVEPYHIQIDDFVQGYSPQGYVNEIDPRVMTELLGQSNDENAAKEDDREIRLNEKAVISNEKIENPWMIHLAYGYSRRLARISKDIPYEFRNYMDQLKSGSNISAEIVRFFTNTYGIGLKHTVFKSSNRMDNLMLIDENTGEGIAAGSMEDNISYSLTGPVFSERYTASNRKIIILGEIMAGYLAYKDDSNLLGVPIPIEGSTIGYSASFAFDYLFTPKLAFGISLSFMNGSMKQFTVGGNTVKLSQGENLSRIDISGGMMLYL